ncbi:MAG: TatD family hydrolase [Candidatus Woesearchaeota archaeon]
MLFIDVHAHLDMKEFDSDREEIITACVKDTINIILNNGIHDKSNREVLELAKKHPNCRAALGIYPTHIVEWVETGEIDRLEQEFTFIEEQLKSKKAIAVGEVGLEYKEIEMNDERKKIMKDALIRFIRLAKKFDVPILLHSRGAEFGLIELLESEGMKGNSKVIMHCFCGRKHLVKRARDNGWTFSIPALVLKTQQFQEIVRDTPMNQLITETDSPHLAPQREERNDPRTIKLIVAKIAEIKGLTIEETANMIYRNYQELFRT